MASYEIGDNFDIHCYKHNGKLHKVWDSAIYVGEENDYTIFANNDTTVTIDNGKSWKTKEPAIMFFSKNNWFNIIGQIKPNGIYYYCNIASPYVIEGSTIKYIDYDLDLRVFNDGAFKILDKGEYKYHKKIMNYGTDIDRIVTSELNNLIEMAKNKEFPFNKSAINKYYKIYMEQLKNAIL